LVGGHNIRLAGFLTGYELDVIRKEMLSATADEDDVELTEFQMKLKMGYRRIC
jgi:N utilization substance protein A